MAQSLSVSTWLAKLRFDLQLSLRLAVDSIGGTSRLRRLPVVRDVSGESSQFPPLRSLAAELQRVPAANDIAGSASPFPTPLP